jgi:hypothetical protein
LAAIAGIMSSALVMGCGGGEEAGDAGTNNTTNATGNDAAGTDAP